MSRVYTRTGDRGETSLITGERVPKTDPIVEALGAVDELNSSIGMALAELGNELLSTILRRIQSELFALGADLNSTGKDIQGLPRVTPVMTERLEREIDGMLEMMPEQRTFILPGGGKAGASLHFARAVARRAERRVVAASGKSGFNPEILRYMNRLADFLHVAARYANHTGGNEESAPVYRD
ncbi:MAG: cob(I)yrinic acid a,c-diamide adenosyltransferase [Thermoplasmata archaeon]|uniref:Cob(I)yrinic acid a,c-diamide adenosyltransferase n=1 Tax=Candidatus Sysuiplasma superficiale TaxID=2823368 RepID=A0A8J7YQ00_9ARCH|nr:cob(I)yrinic acid a,c-diamide adenosyltransferase [Candidatus Sysuiplasma superficiale]MBX8644728.1 cob(I)yrinic acid a,c-diamide adenosyltransferase [Candidatus Sysuiplasma superficiale]MCL4346407.1 cob(I)yrinic acid a,c-diamide adenosyltransferase [Candidatus Thermoplasmatota archaeon]